MKIAICDNDDSLIKVLTEYLESYFNGNKIIFSLSAFNDGRALLDSNIYYDIVFLDVEMPNLNGISTGKIIKNRFPNTVVFIITSYNRYLDDAFDLGAYRFLSKPLDTSRLYRAMDAALITISSRNVKVLCGKDESIVISTRDIVYCENINRKTKIITTQGEYYSKEKLSEWRKKLDDVKFFSPHSSYIVNFEYISSFNKSTIVLKWGNSSCNIGISARYQSDFRKKYFMFAERGI